MIEKLKDSEYPSALHIFLKVAPAEYRPKIAGIVHSNYSYFSFFMPIYKHPNGMHSWTWPIYMRELVANRLYFSESFFCKTNTFGIQSPIHLKVFDANSKRISVHDPVFTDVAQMIVDHSFQMWQEKITLEDF
jgi:hypothetical protein